MADLENINAHLFSIEALMERVFDVRVPEEIEQKFRELAGELAPDPLNVDRLRLNRLLHQTPDLADRSCRRRVAVASAEAGDHALLIRWNHYGGECSPPPKRLAQLLM